MSKVSFCLLFNVIYFFFCEKEDIQLGNSLESILVLCKGVSSLQSVILPLHFLSFSVTIKKQRRNISQFQVLFVLVIN